jgi:hypothetical protein
MDQAMGRTVRAFVLFTSGFVLLSATVLVINQTAGFVDLATRVHPGLGTATLWVLILTYTGLVGTPIVLFVRLPAALAPPGRDDGPEFEAHLERLRGRLTKCPQLVGCDLADRPKIEAALQVLDGRAEAIVRDAASSVFLATAVSQSGRLDAILVLAAQSRMIWRIAHVYHQRPNPRDLVHLYANVAATAFVAGELQDIDLSEQVEPVLGAAIGALGASVPGFQVAGTILANCVLSGSANAFLTLRVGMIARRHCGALVIEPKSIVRRAATIEASRLLGGIVSDGTARLSKAIWRVSVDKVNGAVSNAKDAGTKLFAKMWGARVAGQAD